MQYFYKINSDGKILDFYLLDENVALGPFYISEPIPNNLYFGEEIKPKWDFETEQWIEGATEEEISELTKPQPHEPTIEERLEQTEELLKTVTMAFTEYVFMQDMSDDS